MTTLPSPPADIPEAELARSLGVSRDDLKKFRPLLVRAADWHGGEGKPIFITPAGVDKLTALLASQKNEAGGAVQEAAAAAHNGTSYERLIVVKIGSTRILVAKKEGAPEPVPVAEQVRVMVRSSLHFMPGMILERCARDPHYPDVAHYHGRYPRRRGTY